jgi:hypothetical protein
MWDPTGNQLLIECYYQEGIPVNTASQWNQKGEKHKEVHFHHFPDDFDLSVWNEQGECVVSYERGVEDFSYVYNQTQLKADLLEANLNKILEQMNPIVEQHLNQSGNSDTKLAEDLAGLKEALKNMHALKDALTETMKTNLEQAEEARKQLREKEHS